MSKIVEIPALIDMHVHLREPGFEQKETIETGIKSALKGGFGTICPMPNTKPVMDNEDTLKYVLEKASKFPEIRVLPICAVTKNLDTLELVDFENLESQGAIAFSNDGLPILNKVVFKKALESGKLIISHCEEESKEVKWQIDKFLEVLKEGKVAPRLHFAHISKKESLEYIKNAKKIILNSLNWNFGKNCPSLSAETCPHYFTFTKNNLTSNGVFKMNPPLQTEVDKKAVIEAVLDGTIDVISTDHAPHTKEEKLLPYEKAPNGIVGLETALGLTLRVFPLEVLIEKMATNPSKILRIENKKKIKVDIEEEWIVKSENFETKCKISPYENMKLKGKIL